MPWFELSSDKINLWAINDFSKYLTHIILTMSSWCCAESRFLKTFRIVSLVPIQACLNSRLFERYNENSFTLTYVLGHTSLPKMHWTRKSIQEIRILQEKEETCLNGGDKNNLVAEKGNKISAWIGNFHLES